MAVALAKLDLDALTVAAGENVTTAIRADLKEFRAATDTRLVEVTAHIVDLGVLIQSVQRELATLRWMIGIGFTLLSIFLAISTFIRSSGRG